MNSELTGCPELTIGVEEEFFLLHAGTGRTTPIAPTVVPLCGGGRVDVKTELTPVQIEIATGVCEDLDQLRRHLELGRSAVAGAAADQGAIVIASGTPPMDEPGPPPITDSPRYQWLAAQYRSAAEAQGVCGCHVHVGMPDVDTAVRVSDHVRPWLPVLLALSVNSPFCGGRDTGYASWRSIVWSRWPVSGIPPVWRSARYHRDLTAVLARTGVIRDSRMAYWSVRPSPRVPTIEIRVADVAQTVDDTLLLAGLVRGLVRTAMTDSGPVPQFPDSLGRAACWLAARDGMTGQGLDLRSARSRPAWDLADQLMDHIHPALAASGDLALVTAGLARLRLLGTGAERQRAAFHRRGAVSDVIGQLADQFVREPDRNPYCHSNVHG